MYYISDETLDKFIKEDVPYFDLTTWILGIEDHLGTISFFGREIMVLCGTEEAGRICKKLQLDIIKETPSGTRTAPEEVFFEARGNAESLHTVWKVLQNIFEYGSGIATRTRTLVERVNKINPHIPILTTRKSFPGTKELAVKAVLVGGGVPHRLGLSETVLIFAQHRNFLGGLNDFLARLPQMKAKACEKKIIAEAVSLYEAVRFCEAGVDGVQFDKVPASMLKEYVVKLREINPQIIVLAAGGIDEKNIEDYAVTGIDGIVTTSIYFGKPADIGCRLEKG